MSDTEVTELAARLIPAIAGHLAGRLLPAGMSQDDLESAGGLALTLASRSFDPALGFPFEHYAARAIRNAMLTEIKRQRRHNRDRVPLEIPSQEDGGRSLMRPDPNASDPAQIAEAREMVRTTGRKKRASLVLTQVRADSPEAAQVALRAQQLRAAAYVAVSEQNITDVMQALVKNAKAGNVGSARLLLDFIGNGQSAKTTMQQAIIVNQPQEEDIQ